MVRIAHITDLHIRHHQPGTAMQPERLSREMPEVLGRLAPMLGEAADVLVVTGDILDVPDDVLAGDMAFQDADWPVAVEADYRLFKDWLSNLGCPWVAIPGNHDDSSVFDIVFPEMQSIMDVAGMRFVSFRDELNKNRQPVRTGAARTLFDERVSAVSDGPPEVHVHHYTIDPPMTHKGWQYEYTDAAEFKRDIERAGHIRAVLSGHYHPGSLTFGEGDVVFCGTPAFCEAPHPFRIIEIDVLGKATITDHAVDA